jgi:hypothetical protein
MLLSLQRASQGDKVSLVLWVAAARVTASVLQLSGEPEVGEAILTLLYTG